MAPLGRPRSVVAMEFGSGIALQGGAMRPAASRELAARDSDGVHVLLLWHPGVNAVSVCVEDARLGDRFEIAVAPHRALDAFYHPYAYAA
jgi:hypothetical protein